MIPKRTIPIFVKGTLEVKEAPEAAPVVPVPVPVPFPDVPVAPVESALVVVEEPGVVVVFEVVLAAVASAAAKKAENVFPVVGALIAKTIPLLQ
jgi:hypothetical protein